MERILEVDPFNGVTTYFSSEGGATGTWNFRYAFHDVNTDHTKALQNDPEHWKQGVKRDLAHYAHIPNALLLKWHCEGIDIKDPQALFAQVNKREYSYLKATNKIHVVKG